MRTFRKLCRWLHREFGFFAVGLTLVYAVSGIAVNHVRHWDPNYARTVERGRIEAPGTGPTDEVQPLVLERLALVERVKDTWRTNEGELVVFVEGAKLHVDLASGEVERRAFRPRPLLNDLNFMHLNSAEGAAKTAWTVFADAYCGILIVLALSGIFLVKGRRGLLGRGGVWMALGIALPLAFVAWAR